MTDDVSWSSSDPQFATVEDGLALGLEPGQTNIVATLQGKSDQTVLTVTSAALLGLTIEGGLGTIRRIPSWQSATSIHGFRASDRAFLSNFNERNAFSRLEL